MYEPNVSSPSGTKGISQAKQNIEVSYGSDEDDNTTNQMVDVDDGADGDNDKVSSVDDTFRHDDPVSQLNGKALHPLSRFSPAAQMVQSLGIGHQMLWP